MSVLKFKVAHSTHLHKQRRREEKIRAREEALLAIEQNGAHIAEPRQLRTRVRQEYEGIDLHARTFSSSKNITKNYCRAMINFSLSDLAVPYLLSILAKYNLQIQDFREFININKEAVNCIKGLRELLLITQNDSEQIRDLKKVFQEISVVFLKMFSVNWVFSSRITDKRTHLNYRFKILRRVLNPQYFTYLEDFTK